MFKVISFLKMGNRFCPPGILKTDPVYFLGAHVLSVSEQTFIQEVFRLFKNRSGELLGSLVIAGCAELLIPCYLGCNQSGDQQASVH